MGEDLKPPRVSGFSLIPLEVPEPGFNFSELTVVAVVCLRVAGTGGIPVIIFQQFITQGANVAKCQRQNGAPARIRFCGGIANKYHAW